MAHRFFPFAHASLLAAALACAPGQPAPAAAGDHEDRIHRIATGLLTHNVVRGEEAGLAVEDRLRFYGVPAVSVAVFEDGRIVWARAWGDADTTTLFQAASISKPVAAAGALRLVERGALDLDDDVNRSLRSWRLPETRHTAVEKVTLRRLLSHSAGTTVHGFPGYVPGAPVPSLVQVLDGDGPANTAPVRVDTVPGSVWRYSGGGTSIVQLLMADATGRPFDDLMRDLVLGPAGMHRSTFAQPLPAGRGAEAATAHRGDGSPIAGGHHIYPEQAAAGLWTTPSDLARFALHIQRARAGGSGMLLSAAMARLMTTRQAGSYGLGFAVEGEGDAAVFGHGGSNAGFQSRLIATLDGPRAGRGAVVMTNGDGGTTLVMELLRAIAAEYHLPGLDPRLRDAVPIRPADAVRIAGDYYALAPGLTGARPADPTLTVRMAADGTLRADIPRIGWRGRTLRAAPDGALFFLENAGELALERDAEGRVVAVTVTGVGPPARLERR